MVGLYLETSAIKKKSQFLDLLQNIDEIKILVSLTTAEILPFQPTNCWLLDTARHPVSGSHGLSRDIRAAQAGFLLSEMLTVILQHM